MHFEAACVTACRVIPPWHLPRSATPRLVCSGSQSQAKIVANPGEREGRRQRIAPLPPGPSGVFRQWLLEFPIHAPSMPVYGRQHDLCELRGYSHLKRGAQFSRYSKTGMRGIRPPPPTGCWNRCGPAQRLETPTQTTPDLEIRPESQKPLVPPRLSAQMTSAEDGLRSRPLSSCESRTTSISSSSSVAHTDSGGVDPLRVAPRFIFCMLELLGLAEFIPTSGPG